jgi:hypothetical protein
MKSSHIRSTDSWDSWDKFTTQRAQYEILSHPLNEWPITFPSGLTHYGRLITLVRPRGLWFYGAACWTGISATNGTE